MAILFNHHVVAGSFLCSLVLASCVSKNKYELLEASNTQLQAENTQLKQQVSGQSKQLSARQGEVTRLQGAVKYTIESDLLFPSGSWEMSEEGKQTLAEITQKLAPTQQNKLVVNGYTDNAPIGPELERKGITSNEVLSRKRAEAVQQFLISQGVRPDLITVVGHGEANPVATNETPAGRSKNRRVELTLGG